MYSIKQVQKQLLKLGYDLGKGRDDGILGRATITAIAQFQKDQKLDIKWPGTIGPQTLDRLGLVDPSFDPAPVILPPWFDYAKTFLDLHEVRDAKKLDKVLKLDASEIPWCGAFVGMAISATLPTEVLPSNPLGARNWMKLKKLPGPQIGALAVFYRGAKEGWQGHVTFTAGHDKTHVHGLGGNQSNKVSIARISKDRLLGYYWPRTYKDAPTSQLPFSTINAAITTNEA